MIVLNSVDSLLEHIKEVQEDVVGLSNDSLLKMSNYIENHNLEVDDDISTALQYQDIITQQLSATIEAIDSMKSSMKRFVHAYEQDETLAKESMGKLEEKLNTTLAEAKDKKHDDVQVDEIEFF